MLQSNIDSYVIFRHLNSWGNRAKCLEMNGQYVFWKLHGSKLRLLQEIAGTNIASYITGGLVPVARFKSYLGYVGTEQDWLELSNVKFLEQCNKAEVAFDKIFSRKQIYQLFLHMVADRLIGNWDTHHKQYSINSMGDVVSFDKEHSFSHDTTASVLNEELMLHANLWRPSCYMNSRGYFYINSMFARSVLRKSINIDMQDYLIQEMFSRCEMIGKNDINVWCGEYANLRFVPGKNDFLDALQYRINTIRPRVFEYFSAPSHSALKKV